MPCRASSAPEEVTQGYRARTTSRLTSKSPYAAVFVNCAALHGMDRTSCRPLQARCALAAFASLLVSRFTAHADVSVSTVHLPMLLLDKQDRYCKYVLTSILLNGGCRMNRIQQVGRASWNKPGRAQPAEL
jgi:hypothetical protein